jgi:hypothetical protein
MFSFISGMEVFFLQFFSIFSPIPSRTAYAIVFLSTFYPFLQYFSMAPSNVPTPSCPYPSLIGHGNHVPIGMGYGDGTGVGRAEGYRDGGYGEERY